MASPYASTVNAFYLAYYGRPADPAGLAFWTQQLEQAGGNFNEIVKSFANSAEATARFGNVTIEQRINQIYQDLFDRAPDATGLQFWLGEIQSGKRTVADMAIAVLQGAVGTDLQLINQRQKAAEAFTSQLQSQNIKYDGLTAAETARLLMQSVTKDTTDADLQALVSASTKLANLASTNPAVIQAITGTGSLVTVLDSLGNKYSPLSLTNLVLSLATSANGNAANLTGLLKGNDIAGLIKVLPAGTTVDSVTKALNDGGVSGGISVIYPTTPTTPTNPTTPTTPTNPTTPTPDLPTFSVKNTAGDLTYEGTATGDITFTVSSAGVLTFQRAGVTATTIAALADIASSSEVIKLAEHARDLSIADSTKLTTATNLSLNGKTYSISDTAANVDVANANLLNNAAAVTASGSTGVDQIDLGNNPNGPVTVAVTLNLQAGNDVAAGGNGNDTLRGGDGNDHLSGATGDDTIQGDDGDDSLFGGDGTDNLAGGNGNDSLEGGDGDDTLTGGAGGDIVNGGAGADALDGGDGDDTFLFTASETLTEDRRIAGGNGLDTIRMTRNGDITLADTDFANVTGMEMLVLANNSNINAVLGVTASAAFSSGLTLASLGGRLNLNASAMTVAISVEGNTANDRIIGSSGNDSLLGKDGDDTLSGGNGNDTLDGGNGNDTFLFDDASNQLENDASVIGGNGTDIIDIWNGVEGVSLIDSDFSKISGMEVLMMRSSGDSGLTSNARLGASASAAFTSGITVQIESADQLNLNASAMSVSVNATGGSRDDIIAGGKKADTLTGMGGADTIEVGDYDGQADTVVFTAAGQTDSRSTNFYAGGSTTGMDVISQAAAGDKLKLWDGVLTANTRVVGNLLTDATADKVAVVQGDFNVFGQFMAGNGLNDNDYIVQWADGNRVESVVLKDYGREAPVLQIDASADTLTFKRPASNNIVVFDLINGVSSSHSNRTFDPNISYTIYIRVDSDSRGLNTTPTSPGIGTWGKWQGQTALGRDDIIVLVGDGSDVLSSDRGAVDSVVVSAWNPFDGWRMEWRDITDPAQGYYTGVADLRERDGYFSRYGPDSNPNNRVYLFETPVPFTGPQTNPNSDNTLQQVHLAGVPAGILEDQGLL